MLTVASMPSWLYPETSEALYPGMSDGQPLDEEEEEEGRKGFSITTLLHLLPEPSGLEVGPGRVWQVRVSSGGKLLLLQEDVKRLEEVVSAETRRKSMEVEDDMEDEEEEVCIAGCLAALW